MATKSPIGQRWDVLGEALDERQRRILVGVEAKVLGRGGIAAVALATGVSRTTIMAGISEIEAMKSRGFSADQPPTDRTNGTRQVGGGRKKIEIKDTTLLPDLMSLMGSSTRGDPESPLRWTCKSLRNLAEELQAQGHKVSHVVVGKLLKSQGYSLQTSVKVLEGNQSIDRNAQFEHINTAVAAALQVNHPVISVATKKKELVGAHKDARQESLPSERTVNVKVQEFFDKDIGRATPYGVDEAGPDEAWVSVGTDHDTAAFAGQTIRRWWFSMGQQRYPQAKHLVITTDGGGTNGHGLRLWQLELGRLAQETGLDIEVHHLPLGTSKWNKIEHRLLAFITMNWGSRPLTSHEVVVNLIASTKARGGLTVRAELDPDAELDTVKVENSEFHGDWNYRIRSTCFD